LADLAEPPVADFAELRFSACGISLLADTADHPRVIEVRIAQNTSVKVFM
jgi:hypothetical protein